MLSKGFLLLIFCLAIRYFKKAWHEEYICSGWCMARHQPLHNSTQIVSYTKWFIGMGLSVYAFGTQVEWEWWAQMESCNVMANLNTKL